jgi:hypothetical protein
VYLLNRSKSLFPEQEPEEAERFLRVLHSIVDPKNRTIV